MGILATPVTINGTVCRNCCDVDWARKAEAEDTKKRADETAKKATEATGQMSSFDNQPVTTLDGSLKDASRAWLQRLIARRSRRRPPIRRANRSTSTLELR